MELTLDPIELPPLRTPILPFVPSIPVPAEPDAAVAVLDPDLSDKPPLPLLSPFDPGFEPLPEPPVLARDPLPPAVLDAVPDFDPDFTAEPPAVFTVEPDLADPEPVAVLDAIADLDSDACLDPAVPVLDANLDAAAVPVFVLLPPDLAAPDADAVPADLDAD